MSSKQSDGFPSGNEHPIVEQVFDDVARIQPEVVNQLDAADIEAIEPERLTGSVIATMAVLVVAAFVTMLMETALGVALPSVMRDLRIEVDVAQWLTTGFLLTMAVVIPTTGWLMQRLTMRTLFCSGMAVFAVGTLLAALSPSFAVLLLGRVLQACGTAVVLPQLMATTLSAVPLRFRGTVMGFNTVVIMAAPALGPTLSGFVVDSLGWHWLFWFVLPVAVAVLLAGVFVLKTDGETRSMPLDVWSILLSVIGFGGVIYLMASVRPMLDGARLPIVLGVLGVIGLVLFVLRQVRLRRTGTPLLDLSTLSIANFRVGTIMMTAIFATLFGALTVLPIHLQLGLGYSAVATGLILLPGPVLQGVLAPLIGRVSDIVGPRPLVIPGSIGLCVGVFGLIGLRPGVPTWQIVVTAMLISIGMGLMMTPMLAAVLGSLPKEQYGHGSAIINTLQQVAGAAGTGLVVAIMSIGTAAAAVAGMSGVDAQTRGSQIAFVVSGALALVALVCAFFVRRPDLPPAPATTLGE